MNQDDSSSAVHVRHVDDDDDDKTPNNAPSLLSTCAKSDKGGGVSLNDEVFAIYSTATLPPLWRDILHSGDISNTVERLNTLSERISTSLPIYISWNDIPSRSLGGIQSLRITTTTSTVHQGQILYSQNPHFLLNASLSSKHCIIGQTSKTETLLVILRRPWCVLEICVNSSNPHDTETLKTICAFAQDAHRVDRDGYGAAVFLLGFEIEARRRRLKQCQHQQTVGITERKRAYEVCNSTVFIPSLSSFNSFWIRLICVCAIEMQVSFSCVVRMLCGQERMPDRHVGSRKPDIVFESADAVRYVGRRHSVTALCSSFSFKTVAEGDDDDGDVAQRMLKLYEDVLRRTVDSI